MALDSPSEKPGGKLPYQHAEPRVGSRLLPQVVDELARSNPERIYASIPLYSDPSLGFQDVTMLDLAQAVNHFAWWLEEHLGKSTTFGTLAYIGLSDLRYVIVFLAAVKCGYKVSDELSSIQLCLEADIFRSFFLLCGIQPP